MSIRTDDVLHFLVARAGAPSSMGAQLDRMRTGTVGKPDPFRARDEAETQILVQAHLLRCLSEFAEKAEFRPTIPYKALEKVQKHTFPRLSQGYIALGTLRAYQEWSTSSSERGLVAVYHYIGTLAPTAVPPPPKNEPDIVQAFRTGKAKRARGQAAEVYADSLLALGGFLATWNKRRTK